MNTKEKGETMYSNLPHQVLLSERLCVHSGKEVAEVLPQRTQDPWENSAAIFHLCQTTLPGSSTDSERHPPRWSPYANLSIQVFTVEKTVNLSAHTRKSFST